MRGYGTVEHFRIVWSGSEPCLDDCTFRLLHGFIVSIAFRFPLRRFNRFYSFYLTYHKLRQGKGTWVALPQEHVLPVLERDEVCIVLLLPDSTAPAPYLS